MFEKICLEYKKAMSKYTKGTGGGPGSPENFEVWQTRDPAIWFDDYTNHTTYLTWIHLADRQSEYLLYAKYEGLPITCRMDGTNSLISSL